MGNTHDITAAVNRGADRRRQTRRGFCGPTYSGPFRQLQSLGGSKFNLQIEVKGQWLQATGTVEQGEVRSGGFTATVEIPSIGTCCVTVAMHDQPNIEYGLHGHIL